MKIKPLIIIAILISECIVVVGQPPRSYSSSEILLQLKKLNTVGSVLYIAAHPDDENTRLIAYLANEKCLRTGYLSLTRGDGGQNLIGPEQGVELGIVRTQELLAARRIDGGEQYFTRAYDFGFSKSPKETFQKWNHDSVLADVVWVIRNFRPDIIITRFATDGSGGHGHHTASAILAEEAFDAAGDPKMFPEQLKYVKVWQPRRLFWNVSTRFFNPNADMTSYLKLDVGGYNSLLGKSYGEIAAESRSMHRSQGFGSGKQRGESLEYFKPIRGDTANLKDIFDGMNINLNNKFINAAYDFFKNDHFQEATNSLIKTCDEKLNNGKSSDKYHSELQQKIILQMNGIIAETVVENLANTSNGDSIALKSFVINRRNSPVEIKKINLMAPYCPNPSISNLITLNNNTVLKTDIPSYSSIKFKICESTTPSLMHWMSCNPVDNKFVIPNQLEIGDAYHLSSQIFATYVFSINNKEFTYGENVQFKWVDPSKGELYRPLVITPPVMINLNEKSIVFAEEKEKEVKVIVKAGKDSVKFDLHISLPNDWFIKSNPSEKSESSGMIIKQSIIAKKGEERIFIFYVIPPAKQSEAMMKLTAIVDDVEYSKGIKEIKYDHIPVQTIFPEAEAKLVRLEINKKSKQIGYIPGAGDEVQQCLQQLGYQVTTLSDEMLGKENLNQFDAIITGVRAYNVNEKLPNFKQKLMEYVIGGGNLIVQYNTNNFIGTLKGDFGPYPFKITRERVTDENAVVTFELPEHAVLNIPNKITDKDFSGWIQERCIYSATDTSAKYEMPLSMADPDEKPNKGSLIIAKYGKGNFIYTGLVFFRELPAGIPGAYRLFVNMIELGK